MNKCWLITDRPCTLLRVGHDFFLTSLIEISLDPFLAINHHLGTMAFKKQRTTLSTDGESIRQHDDPLDDPPAEIMKPPFTAFKDVEVVANLTNQKSINNGICKLWMLVKSLWAAREAVRHSRRAR